MKERKTSSGKRSRYVWDRSRNTSRASELLAEHVAATIIADKGYDADRSKEDIEDHGEQAVIQASSNRLMPRKYSKTGSSGKCVPEAKDESRSIPPARAHKNRRFSSAPSVRSSRDETDATARTNGAKPNPIGLEELR